MEQYLECVCDLTHLTVSSLSFFRVYSGVCIILPASRITEHGGKYRTVTSSAERFRWGGKLNSSALAGDDGCSQTESRLMVNKQNEALTEFVHFELDNRNYNPPLLFPSVTRRRMERNWGKKPDTRRRRSKTVPQKRQNGTPRVPGVPAAASRSTVLKAWWKQRCTRLPIYHPWDGV